MRPGAKAPRPPAAGGKGKRPPLATQDQHLAKVERLMADCTPRLKVYEAMAPMPSRTVDEYMARVRRAWAAAMEAQRPERIAEALTRLDYLIEQKLTEGADLLRAERQRQELLGLVGNAATQVVNVAVGAPSSPQDGPRLADWPAHLVERARPLLEALRALREEAAAWVAGGGRARVLPGPVPDGDD